MRREVTVCNFPSRIVSLVPSITELLFDLGQEDNIVGVTKFCIHPSKKCKMKRKIGGTKNPKISGILSLQPDLIIANKEENRIEDIELLAAHCPVWISDVNSFEDAIDLITKLGNVLSVNNSATNLISKISKQWRGFRPFNAESVLYCIWKNPLMGAGGGTYIDSILHKSGLKNALGNLKRYPEIPIETLTPKYVFLASEPYPFNESDRTEVQLTFPKSKIVLVDGEMFSWYGSRMVLLPDYIKKLVNQIYES